MTNNKTLIAIAAALGLPEGSLKTVTSLRRYQDRFPKELIEANLNKLSNLKKVLDWLVDIDTPHRLYKRTAGRKPRLSCDLVYKAYLELKKAGLVGWHPQAIANKLAKMVSPPPTRQLVNLTRKRAERDFPDWKW